MEEAVDVIAIGLEAVNSLIQGRTLPREWAAENVANLDLAGEPYGSAQVAIVPRIRELVRLAACAE